VPSVTLAYSLSPQVVWCTYLLTVAVILMQLVSQSVLL
jgi:hypothetical protein